MLSEALCTGCPPLLPPAIARAWGGSVDVLRPLLRLLDAPAQIGVACAMVRAELDEGAQDATLQVGSLSESHF